VSTGPETVGPSSDGTVSGAALVVVGALLVHWTIRAFVLNDTGPTRVSDELLGAWTAEYEGQSWPSLLACRVQYGVRPFAGHALLRAGFAFLGPAVEASRVVGLVATSVLIAAGGVAATLGHGASAGRFVSILLATTPTIVACSIAPDPTLFAATSLMIAWALAKIATRSRGVVSSLALFGAGVAVGSTCLFRWEALMVLPFAVVGFLGTATQSPAERDSTGPRVALAAAPAAALASVSIPLRLVTCDARNNGRWLDFYFSQLDVSTQGAEVIGQAPLVSLSNWLSVLYTGTGLALVLAPVGLWLLYRRGYEPAVVLLALMMTFLVYRSATTSLNHEARYATTMIVALLVATGLALGWLESLARRSSPTVGGAGVAALLLGLTVSMYLLAASAPGSVEGRIWPMLRPAELEGVNELTDTLVEVPGALVFVGDPETLAPSTIHLYAFAKAPPDGVVGWLRGSRASSLGQLTDVLADPNVGLVAHPLPASETVLDQAEAAGWVRVTGEFWEFFFAPERGVPY